MVYFYYLEDAFNYFNYLKYKFNSGNYYILNLIKSKYWVCQKSNVSKSIIKNVFIISVYYFQNFQNMILHRRHIVSNEISMNRRRHGRPFLKYLSEFWYLRL